MSAVSGTLLPNNDRDLVIQVAAHRWQPASVGPVVNHIGSGIINPIKGDIAFGGQEA
jgi:hypothetical protein